MFDLPQQERSELWNKLTLAFEKYFSHTEDLKVCPDLNQTEIIAFIENFEFDENYLSTLQTQIIAWPSMQIFQRLKARKKPPPRPSPRSEQLTFWSTMRASPASSRLLIRATRIGNG